MSDDNNDLMTRKGKSIVPSSSTRCSTCENVFPTLMSLEAHKEETNHWSDDDLFLDDDDDDDDDEIDDFYDDEVNEEEREKLL